ncbi:hypothetical protein JCM8202_004116 [Rhodotorula sphaerocarpa]
MVAIQTSASPRLGTHFAANRGRKQDVVAPASPQPGLRWKTGGRKPSLSRRPSTGAANLLAALDLRSVAMTPKRFAGLVFLIFLAGYSCARMSRSPPDLEPVRPGDGYRPMAAKYEPLTVREVAPAPHRYIAEDPDLEAPPARPKAAGQAGGGRKGSGRRQGPARMAGDYSDGEDGEEFAPVDPRRQVIGGSEEDPAARRPEHHAAKARDKQFQRLKKVAAAKAQNARVAEAKPEDLAARAARDAQQDPVIREESAGKQRKVKRPPSGTLAEFAAEVKAVRGQAEKEPVGRRRVDGRGRRMASEEHERELELELEIH